MILPILNIIRKLVNKYVQVSIQAAYKLRLYLMASLIMLTASIVVAIPMNSTKLFQNAMASGKHSYKNYKYQDEKIIIILMNRYLL